MIIIKKDTILRPGDLLTPPNGNEKWQVKTMNGMKVNIVNPATKSERLILKNDLIFQHWTLEIGNGRGYW
jgi:hypothetical protein